MVDRLITLIVVRAASRRRSSAALASEANEVASSGMNGSKSPSGLRAARAWTRRNVLLPATFGYRHLQPLGSGTLPTRAQSLLVALFAVLNVTLTPAGYNVYHDSIL
jgi:hypothetical protein